MATIKKKIKALVGSNNISLKQVDIIITNDEIGKTITIADEHQCFTFSFEEIEEYLK